jgi:hypothetical protein
LFNHGFSYASVGFGENGMNILDPMAGDAMIAGVAVTAKLQPPYTRDVEIIKQFSESLTSDGYAAKLLGPIERRYAYGVSQSAEALFELFFGVGAQGLFDLTVMHVPLWRPAFAQPDVLNALPENFMAQDGIGKVMFVAAEGDQIISGSRQLRAAVAGANAHPNFRLYEVAGAPHLPLRGPFIPPQELNPLDIAPVVRAVFVAGNRWSKFGNEPPRSALLGAAPADEVDPYYGRPTGIARDADGNAQGGVRFPDLQIGRAHFLASAPFEVIPGLPGLAGLWTDLSCEPVAGSKGYRARIRSHGFYVRAVARQALRLFFQGYLLPEDMRSLFRDAIHADVGKPGSCDDAP